MGQESPKEGQKETGGPVEGPGKGGRGREALVDGWKERGGL